MINIINWTTSYKTVTHKYVTTLSWYIIQCARKTVTGSLIYTTLKKSTNLTTHKTASHILNLNISVEKFDG